MRRIGLFLLVFVLTLQMSWAAVHYCDDTRTVPQTATADGGGHFHEAEADDQLDGKAEKIADACCGAAHGCHGLHHLMGHAEPAFAPTATSQMSASSGAAPPLSEPHSRIERPNWSAA